MFLSSFNDKDNKVGGSGGLELKQKIQDQAIKTNKGR